MADIKWIKITTDMFDNRKIKHLRRLPGGNDMALIWVMLLTIAGRCNADGLLYLTESIPYTPQMLANELGFPDETVEEALAEMEQLQMIEEAGDFLRITGWEEHQNIDGLDRVREQTRTRVAKYRKRQESQTPAEKKREPKPKPGQEEKADEATCGQVVELYHSICVSFPHVRTVSEARKKAIRARLKAYKLEDFRALFEKAEASDFLKGANDRNWTATFDWLISDANMAKVIDGNYDNRKKGPAPARTAAPNRFHNFQERDYDFKELEKQLINT